MRALVLIALLVVTACATNKSDETILEPVEFSDIPGWKKDQQADTLTVFAESCKVNKRRANAWKTKLGEPVGDPVAWAHACDAAIAMIPPPPPEPPVTTPADATSPFTAMAPVDPFAMLPPPGPTDDEARQFFQKYFDPVRVKTGREPLGHMTGYYEPLLRGSTTQTGPFQTPVYGVPHGNAHYSRAQIDAGALKGKAPVLLYVDDPVMLFFLHIQGSGKVQLPDGSIIGLQYAAQNGYQYVAIGGVMKNQGLLTEVSLQTIRAWLYANPGAPARAIMETNPSYIYFKLSPGDAYAKGALGISLTPGRSIAIDDDRATYGVPTYIATTRPKRDYNYNAKFRRLFVSQDTGGALHGPHRADIFFGRGEQEEWSAGVQNSRGKVYWLLPKFPGTE